MMTRPVPLKPGNSDNKDKNKDKALPLVEHLLELRTRLLRCLLVILIIFVGLVPFANEVYELLSSPLRAIIPSGATMIATHLITPFWVPLKLCIYTAMFVAMPYLLHQLWAFIAPGMYRNEKKLIILLFLSSILLFYLGVLFSYAVVFPLIFSFLVGIGPDSVSLMPDISNYLDLVIKLFLAFGLTFEIPIIILIITRMELTTTKALSQKRPYIIVGFFAIGMLLTPPDVFSQALLAIPMCLLFELGLLLSVVINKSKQPEPNESV